MRILITGYKGFIGSNAMTFFSELGHECIGYEWGDGDIDVTTVDWVMHFGAISDTTYTNVEQLLLQNYTFTKRLLNECDWYGVPIQISSSASVYGIHNTTYRETDLPAPRNYYAFSKYLVEEYAEKIVHCPVQVFRYFNVYGPNEDHKGDQASPYHKFTEQAKKGNIVLFENSDKFKRDFIHVKDILDYHHKFMKSQESGLWNLGSGRAVSFEKVAKDIAKEYNADIRTIAMPEHLKASYQEYTCANMTKTWETVGGPYDR